jgi:hypothetical protein
MRLAETIHKWMGWCPVKQPVQANLLMQPETRAAGAPGDRDGIPGFSPGWRSRYHNQLLINALSMSGIAAALFLLFEDASGYPVALVSIVIGAAAAVGLWLNYRKRYARVAAGEFIGDRLTRNQRIIRYLAILVFSVIIFTCVVYFALHGMYGRILALMWGASLICWAAYALTIYWERRHRAILISEKGSMYTIDAAVRGDNRVKGGRCQ